MFITKGKKAGNYGLCNIKVFLCNHRCRGKVISVTYSECVCVALVTQHAKLMRRFILSPVTSLAPPYFTDSSHKRHEFREKLLNTKRVFWFSLQLLSETFLIIRRIYRHFVINVQISSCKVRVIPVRFQWNLNVLDRVSKKKKKAQM